MRSTPGAGDRRDGRHGAETCEPDGARMREAAERGYSTATDLADWLVACSGMPFREAHHVTGSLVAMAEGKGCTLAELTLAEMQSVEPRITKDVYTVLSVEASVASRTSFGGTAATMCGAKQSGGFRAWEGARSLGHARAAC